MGLDIQSKEVIDKISDELKVQPSLQIPRELAKQIQLSYIVNPIKKIQAASSTLSDGTSVTLFTTHPIKRTFFVGGQLSISKDAIATSIKSNITIVPIGKAFIELLGVRYEPTTAGSNIRTELHLKDAIELEKNSAVAIKNNLGVASIDTAVTVFFYETDPQ